MRYAELHCRTAFSFLEGASHPEQLIARALQLRLSALAITDRNGLYGIVEARERLCEIADLERADEGRAPLRLLYGSEITVTDETGEDAAVLIVADLDGYHRLASAITRGRLAAEKGEFRLSFAELAAETGGGAGLHVIAGGPRSAAMRHLAAGDEQAAARALARWRDAFGDRVHVELVRHLVPGDHARSLAMAVLARRLGAPLVASNDVCLHDRSRKPLHDVLRCVAGGFRLDQAGRRLLPNAEPHLKSGAEMAALFSDLPDAVARAAELADAVDFRLTDVRYTYPPPVLPPGETADSLLSRLAWDGLRSRLGERADGYRARLQKELDLIAELRYAGYFLTMWEVINLCREKRILCQGRGSAANSLVCYGLGITSVSPDTIDMLFERFLSRERNEPPDIDLDIEHERREEIIQHVYNQYGRHHAAMVAEVIRYRFRSAVREAGKALGFSEAELGRMSKFLTHHIEELDRTALAACGIDPHNPNLRSLLRFARAMSGLPRHLSIHVGGFILSDVPIGRIAPIENGRMADRTVIQWAKDDVDAMGMFKLDLLGLGMLTVLSKCFALVRDRHGLSLGLETIPEGDAATYEMIRQADTIGVFQIESRAQMNMLPRLEPDSFYDLVIEVAIVRPGPIQGKMVHPYLRRRRGLEQVEYPHPSMRSILHRTLGVPLFQEQVMRLAEAVGGYTPGQADQLRRDMASWHSEGKMVRHRERLIPGMLKSGLTLEFAERVFQQIEGFGSYGFPESHAAAFAHLAYVSAYLKCHYPMEFAVALLNSQPMGFYSPAVILNDARRHGVGVLRPDVQSSGWDSSIEDGEGVASLRMGLRLVRGLGEDAGVAIEKARIEGGRFRSVEDLAHRAGVPSRALVPLAASGALSPDQRNTVRHKAAFGDRRQAVWRASAAARPHGPLYAGAAEPAPPPPLPPVGELEALSLDAKYASSFPDRHPMELIRDEMRRQRVLSAAEAAAARSDSIVEVAGLVITRQRPESANGALFLTLEDETGHVDVSLSEKIFLRFQNVVRLSHALRVRGRITADGRARNVSALRLTPLRFERALRVDAHDFH
ncbi:MAG TPA: error-prone DNA polymerase [Kofleriaceae bacterium]|nr:error-prone DNA polymerase [Kofleriaceae bacterium]